MKVVTIALDVGATKTIIARVAGDRVVAERRFETRLLVKPGGNITDLIARVREFWKPNVQAIAVSFAGIVSGGRVLAAPNFSDTLPPRFPLARMLGEVFGVSVLVRNDGECFTVGEAVLGAARRRRVVVGVMLGTGVGGGIVIDRQPYRGTHQLAGEFGHLPFLPSSGRCGCGQVGHLEQVLSGPGLSTLYELGTRRSGSGESVVRAARRGDAAATAAMATAQEALVHLLLTILVTWDPDIIIVGGGLAAVPKLLVSARRAVRERVPFSAMKKVPIIPSFLHERAVLLGAARTASEFLRVGRVQRPSPLRKVANRLRRLRPKRLRR